MSVFLQFLENFVLYLENLKFTFLHNMSKERLSNDNNYDSGIGTERDSEEASRSPNSAPAKETSLRRPHRYARAGFKSLTGLSAKDSLESLQKMRRRGEIKSSSKRAILSRGTGSAEKRGRKKQIRKKFDKPSVFEVSIRRIADELAADARGELLNIVSPRKVGVCSGRPSQRRPGSDTPGARDSGKRGGPDESASAPSADQLLGRMGQLRLGEDAPAESRPAAEPEDAGKGGLDFSSGDAHHRAEEEGPHGGCCCAGAAPCARSYGLKSRSVQWNREVDVIYYAGDADGGKVVRRENEPLREEAEQQARRNRFIQLALTKNLLSNVSACQLREPWLVVLPK